jgi:penicillin amidase
LSEFFGHRTVDADKLLRTLGPARKAQQDFAQLPAKYQSLIQSYVDGINAFVESDQFLLPIEYQLLELKSIDKFKPTDVAAWSRLLAWQMSKVWNISHPLSSSLFAFVC